MSLFCENTTMLGASNLTSGFNAATGLSEALFESANNDHTIMEAMMRVDAVEIKMLREGSYDNAAMTALREGAAKRAWDFVVKKVLWLRDKIVAFGKAFWKAVKTFFSKNNQIVAAYKRAVQNKELMKAIGDKEVNWIVFKKHPVDYSIRNVCWPCKPDDIFKKGAKAKDKADMAKAFFGVSGDGDTLTSALQNKIYKAYLGETTIKHVKIKIKNIPEHNKFDDLSSKLNGTAEQFNRDIDQLGKMLSTIEQERDKLTIDGADADEAGKKMIEAASVYCTGTIQIMNYYRSLFTMEQRQVASIMAMIAKAGSGSTSESVVDDPVLDLIGEAVANDVDACFESTYVLEADDSADDEDDDEDEEGEAKPKGRIGQTMDKIANSKVGQAVGGAASKVANSKVGQAVATGWAKIKELFAKLGNMIESAVMRIVSMITSDKKLIAKYKDKLSGADSSRFDSVKCVSYVARDNYEFEDVVVAWGKSLQEYEELTEKMNSVVLVADEGTVKSIHSGIASLFNAFSTDSRDIEALKKNLNGAKANLKRIDKMAKAKDADQEGLKLQRAYYNAMAATAKIQIKAMVANHKADKATLIRCLGVKQNKSEATISMLIEASNEEIDNDIATAINTADAQGIEDVNLDDSDPMAGASTDPYALTYDKTDSYSATTDMGDVTAAGTIDTDYTSGTRTSVKSGNETPQLKESAVDKALDNFFWA